MPSLDVQQEIVAEIEGYQKVIDGARAVIDNYRPHIPIDHDWPMVNMGSVCEVLDRLRKPITKDDRDPGPYPYYGSTGVVDWVADYIFDEPLILIGEDGAKWEAGERTAFAISGKTWVNNHAHVLRPNRDSILDKFLIAIVNQLDFSPYITGVTVPKLNQRMLNSIQLPLPSVAVQGQYVSEIESEHALVDANRELVRSFDKKVQAVIEGVWEAV